ncbi:MAG: SDR family oxidoreductase [Alphaproteobacteria bacterium]|nr:SDR family oxidoreductase [Alphaproteobacteria bacterium]
MIGRVLVVGATGPTGREVLARAKAEGLAVRALARNPARLAGVTDAIQGDVRDRESLVRAMAGIGAVVSALGTKQTLQPVTLLSEGTRNIVEAMHEAGVSRLLCITGMGAGDSRGNGGFLYDRLILTTLLARIYADKDRQEQVVRSSDLDWVLIRPARLVNAAAAGTYREITRFANQRMTTISRGDVAHFVVREVMFPRYHRQTVNLTDGPRTA